MFSPRVPLWDSSELYQIQLHKERPELGNRFYGKCEGVSSFNVKGGIRLLSKQVWNQQNKIQVQFLVSCIGDKSTEPTHLETLLFFSLLSLVITNFLPSHRSATVVGKSLDGSGAALCLCFFCIPKKIKEKKYFIRDVSLNKLGEGLYPPVR